MKSFKFLQYFIWLLIVIGFYGCKKHSDNSIQQIDPAKVYTGTIIAVACPGYAVIHVANANIGEAWKPGTTLYKNVIAISNCPDSIKKNNTVSFNLIVSKNCVDPCLHLMDITFYSYEKPLKIYCANSIKSVK